VTLPICQFVQFRSGNPHVVPAGHVRSDQRRQRKEHHMYIGIGTLLLIIILIILFT
jgi:hypothetical protein